MTLGAERIRTLDDIRAFLDGNVAADITPHDRKAAYAFVERTLVRFRYRFGLSRAGKGLVRRCLARVTGYSGSQLARLIEQQRRSSSSPRRRTPPRDPPTRPPNPKLHPSITTHLRTPPRPHPPARSCPCLDLPRFHGRLVFGVDGV